MGNAARLPSFLQGHSSCAHVCSWHNSSHRHSPAGQDPCLQGGRKMFLCGSQWSRSGALFPWQDWKVFILSPSPSHTYFLFFVEQVICLYLTIHLPIWLQLMELSPLCTHVPFLNLSGLWPPKVTTASEVIWLSESFWTDLCKIFSPASVTSSLVL